ncbi:MAG TPA: hypothetical protein VM032_17130 [Vicinamibacterales bacterium]|nr:hypothetical protein [Vicinamibacterales bacterium]
MRHLPAAAAALLALMLPASVTAQTGPSTLDSRPLGAVFPADVIRDLPLADSVYSLIETTQSEVIADRFNSGGLNVGGGSRAGGFLGSWSQTVYRIGDVDVSDPAGSGASLFVPDASLWQQVTVATGLMPPDLNTPGLAVTLGPRRAGSSWNGTILGSGSGGSLAAGAPAGQPVPIVRLKDYVSGAASAGGPLSERVSLALAGTFARGASYRREQLASTRSTNASGLAHLVFAATPDLEWRLLAGLQRSATPFEYWPLFRDPGADTTATAVHAQTTLERHAAGAARWRVFAGFTQRDRRTQVGPPTVYVDRIVDGPIPDVVDAVSDTATRRVSFGARVAPEAASDATLRLEYGAGLDHASTTSSNLFAGTVRETVNALPARIWSYNAIAGEPSRATTTGSAFASAGFTLSPRLLLDAGLRAEVVHGGAEDAATTVSWLSVLPHARLTVALGGRRVITLGYARSANALTHNWLAWGDPAAATARVVSAAAPNTLVARVGPGINGNPSFSGLGDDLARPTTDEFIIAYEKRRSASTRYTLTGIARRETNMLAVVNTGTSAASYAAIGLPDAGKDLTDPSDDRTLVVYNRLPASFGLDTYLVTNPDQEAAAVYALRMSLEHSSDRLFLIFGATASAALGSGGNRGYGPLENDQDVPGELFTNPNAASYARGRLFSDRAFTIKWTTLYRFPGDFTVAGIARYQDGQPFSRMVVVPNLNQGVEAVQAYPNAGSRYTFTGTLDLRMQKGFRAGRGRIDAIVDAYNLLTRNNEVEEYVVSGPAFRTPTAIEPPYSVHFGLRVTF